MFKHSTGTSGYIKRASNVHYSTFQALLCVFVDARVIRERDAHPELIPLHWTLHGETTRHSIENRRMQLQGLRIYLSSSFRAC